CRAFLGQRRGGGGNEGGRRSEGRDGGVKKDLGKPPRCCWCFGHWMVARLPRKPRSDGRRNYCGVPNAHMPGIHRRDGVGTKVCARSWRIVGRHSSLSVVVGEF